MTDMEVVNSLLERCSRKGAEFFWVIGATEIFMLQLAT